MHAYVTQAETSDIRSRTLSQIARLQVAELQVVSSPSSTIEATDITGCSVVYVWADKLYAGHVIGTSERMVVANLKRELGRNVNKITHILVAGEKNSDVLDETVRETSEWAEVTVEQRTYPEIHGDEEYSISSSFTTPGECEIKRNDK